MKKILIVVAALMWAGSAHAQIGGGVTSSGAITPGDCVSWLSTNVIQDAGSACGGGGGGGSVAISATTTSTALYPVMALAATATATTLYIDTASPFPYNASTGLLSALGVTTTTLTDNGNAALNGTTTISSAQILAGNATLTALTATTVTGATITGSNASLTGTTTANNLSVNGTFKLGSTTFALPVSIANGGTGAATAAADTVFANNTASTAAPAYTDSPVTVSYGLANTTTGTAAAGYTGMRQSAVNTLELVTTGTRALFISTTGSVGIGTNAPGNPLNVVYSDNNFLAGVLVKNTNAGNGSTAGFSVVNGDGHNGGMIYTSNTWSFGPTNTLTFTSNQNIGFQANNSGGFASSTISFIGADGATAMTIGSTSKVGIGTTSIADKLDVNGAIGLTTTTATLPVNGIYLSAANTLDMTTSGIKALEISNAQLVSLPGITSDATHTDSSVCQDTTTHTLYSGSGTLGVCLGTSSARYKTNIITLDKGMFGIEKLKPVSFYYKKGHGDNGAKEQWGFLAEDMVKVFPKLVDLDDEGKPNSVDLVGLIPVLVKTAQDQQKEIEELKKMVRKK